MVHYLPRILQSGRFLTHIPEFGTQMEVNTALIIPIPGRLAKFTLITLAELTALFETLRWYRSHRIRHQKKAIYINSIYIYIYTYYPLEAHPFELSRNIPSSLG